MCEKIDEFNTSINKLINEADLEKFKEVTKQELIEKDSSLEEKINRYKPEIALRTYLFNRNILVRDQVDKITKTSIKEFVDKLFQHSNRKVVIINGN